MDDPSYEVVQRSRRAEGLVAAFVRQNPQASTKNALEEPISRPQKELRQQRKGKDV